MLPQVVAACGKTPVLFDSGVRSGADVVKALALGARMVGVGRPYVTDSPSTARTASRMCCAAYSPRRTF